MSDVIVDRRISGSNRPSVNRAKLLKRHEEVIKQAVRQSISDSDITDLADKKNLKVKLLKEKQPELDISRKQVDHVFIGNKKYRKGNTIPKPPSGQGRPKHAGDQEGEFDPLEFDLTAEEYEKYLFAELEIPFLTKKSAKDMTQKEYQHAGFVSDGNPANLSIIRSFKNGLARNIAMKAAIEGEIDKLEHKQIEIGNPEDYEYKGISDEIKELKQQLQTIPFLDDMDLRYKFREARPVPTAKAVMFCIMDFSGSMTDELKDLAKRFYFLLYLFLRTKYDKFEVVFIRHTTEAEECSGDKFFHETGKGGTMISSALELTMKIIQDRYPPSEYNIYCAQATDNENQFQDNLKCDNILRQTLLPLCQYYIHIHVEDTAFYRDLDEYGNMIEYLQKHNKNLVTCLLKYKGDVWKEFSRIFKPIGNE